MASLKEDIDSQYEKLLALAKEYDLCLEAVSGKSIFSDKEYSVKDDGREKYLKVREELESRIPKWMSTLRKAIVAIPEATRRFTRENRTEETTGDAYSVEVYNDKNFEALTNFFDAIKRKTEDFHGILENISETKPIFSILRNIRGKVLSFTDSLDLFIPENMVTVDQQVDVIFKLRDEGLEEVAIELEGIDLDKDNIKKCLRARTALEKIVSKYCENHGETPKKGFHANLDSAIKLGMGDKAKRKTIAAHYTFVSKIVHEEIEANSKNTSYAVAGVFSMINNLILVNST